MERGERQETRVEFEGPAVQAPAEEIKIFLKDIIVTGATVFSPEEFRPIYEPYLGKTVLIADIQDIMAGIRDRYKDQGYLTTDVVIPPQKNAQGVFELRVVEGKMGKLGVEGNRYFSSAAIREYFHTREGDVRDLDLALRDILRINRNADIQARTVISQGEEAGFSDILLNVQDRRPWHVGMSEDNTGTRLVGKYRTGFFVRGTNVTGRMDTLFLSTSVSRSSFGQSASYRVPVGTYGTKAGLDVSRFRMKLGKELTPVDIDGQTFTYTPLLSRDLWLRDNSSADLEVGVEVKSIKKTAENVETVDDQLRIPFVQMDLFMDDAYGQTGFSPRVDFGTSGFFEASARGHDMAGRAGTGGAFVKYSQDLSRTQRLVFGSYATLRAPAVYEPFAPLVRADADRRDVFGPGLSRGGLRGG